MSELTVTLSVTASTWSREVAPIVEWFAQSLSSIGSDNKPAPSPGTRLTQRRRYEGKGSAVPEAEPTPKQQKVCAGCGGIVSENCPYCHACSREQSGIRLAAASVKGRLAAKSPEAAALKSAKMIAHRNAIENWNPADLPDWLDDSFYLTKIQPALATMRKKTIADALGVSIEETYKFAKGTRIPHKRHWVKLAELVGSREKR